MLVIGDLSFYHDLNGLLAAKLHRLHATIILLNNDGGGIFSFLPQADDSRVTSSNCSARRPAWTSSRRWRCTAGASRARPPGTPSAPPCATGLSGDGLTVIEVRTDRAENVADASGALAGWSVRRCRLDVGVNVKRET